MRCWSVVFCKQKRAYEMRISDWSSDVCSSDLLGGGGDVLEAGVGHTLLVENLLGRVEDARAGFLGFFLGAADHSGLTYIHGCMYKIGSASCRERVCQYV